MNVGISQIWVLSVGMFKVVVCTFTTVNVCSLLSPTLSSQSLCAEEELCCQTPTWSAHWKRLKATHFNWLDGIHVNIIYESQSLTANPRKQPWSCRKIGWFLTGEPAAVMRGLSLSEEEGPLSPASVTLHSVSDSLQPASLNPAQTDMGSHWFWSHSSGELAPVLLCL